MNEELTQREKFWLRLVLVAVIAVTAGLIVETFRLLLPGLWTAFSSGDEAALSAYLAGQGRLRSYLTLWFLSFVQVVSLVIPAMPVQLAAGLVYGPWKGFVTSFSASALANFAVFMLARRLSRVILRRAAGHRLAGERQPWQHVCVGTDPGRLQKQPGFLHGADGKKRCDLHAGLQLWPAGRGLCALCAGDAARKNCRGCAGHCTKRRFGPQCLTAAFPAGIIFENTRCEGVICAKPA